MPVVETAGWRSGKKTRRGRPLDVPAETVTIIHAPPGGDLQREACRVLACPRRQLVPFLRRLRDDGRLVTSGRGRLTARVRFDAPGTRYGVERRRAYVLRGRVRDLPRKRPRVMLV